MFSGGAWAVNEGLDVQERFPMRNHHLIRFYRHNRRATAC